MKNRKAVIDLGTNTFNLLILDSVDDGFESVLTKKVGVGLGLGGINEGRIGAEAWKRGVDTLLEYKALCMEKGVESIHAFGTSAIRNAVNGKDFVDDVLKQTGIRIQVISGLEEARYIYEGVKFGYKFEVPGLIMDIGGGSTEFILADKEGIIKFHSFEIGVSRIYQLFSPQDPYTEADAQRVLDYLDEQTGHFFDDMRVDLLIGSSGSFETFYELVTETPFPQNAYVHLTREEIMISLNRVINSTQAERDKNPLIIPIRKKMAPIAALKIKWIITKLNINQITISPFALKEGVIASIK